MTHEVNELNAKFGHSLMFQDSHSDQLTRLQHAQDEAIGLHMQINRFEEQIARLEKSNVDKDKQIQQQIEKYRIVGDQQRTADECI